MNMTYNIANLARMGKLRVIKKILSKNPLHLIDEPDKFGKTGFLYAAENNDIDMLKFFLDESCNIDHTDNNGYNALALSVLYDSEVTADYLIYLGMRVDICVNGNTLLHCAILNENGPLSYEILKQKADPTIKNYRGYDSYQLAQLKLESSEIKQFEKILEKLGWI